MAGTALYFSVGDGVTGDYLGLNDAVAYLTLPNTLDAPPPKPGEPTRTLTVPLDILAGGAGLAANYQALETKLTQARIASGPWGLGTGVTLGAQLGSTLIFFDVVDGSVQLPQGAFSDIVVSRIHAQLTLTCLPAARGTTQTFSSGTLTAGTAATFFVAGVNGDLPPLTRVTVTDTSGTAPAVIGGLQLGRRALPVMAATDFTPGVEWAALAPGTALADATASGGTCARLTAGTAYQALASAVQPAGQYTTGLFDLWTRVRDAETLVGAVGSLSVTASAMPKRVQFTSATFTNSNTVSISWPNATTEGNALVLMVTTGKTGTSQSLSVAGGWPDQTSTSVDVPITVWTWTGAASRSGAETIFLNLAGDGVVVLAEYSGITARGTTATGSVGAGSTLHLNESAAAGVALTIVATVTASVVGSFSGSTGEVELLQASSANTGTTYGAAVFEHNASALNTSATFGNPGAAYAGISVTFDADSAGYSGTLPPGDYTVTVAGSGSGSAVGLPSPSVEASLSGSGQLALTWTAATNATGYTVYVNDGLATTSVAAGNVTSYSLDSLPTTSASVPTTRQQAELRALVGLGSGAMLTPGDPVTPTVGAGNWEWLNLGTFSLPPQAALDAGTPRTWYVELEALHPTLTPTIDADLLLLMPQDEPQTTITPIGAVTATRAWLLDTRRDGYHSVTILNGGTEAGQAIASAPFYLDKGDNLVIVRCQNSAGVSDVVHTTFTLTIVVTPRYRVIA